MIIEEFLSNRHWAETARLYVGWLNRIDQSNFLKDVAKENILLACECRANLFYENLELDTYLAEIAYKKTKDIAKTRETSNALLALAVLEKYDIILKIFASKKAHSNENFYAPIISDYLSNATEQQTLEFLKILCSSNVYLFEKALDHILENSVIFSPQSKKNALHFLEMIKSRTHEILRLKITCIFQLINLLQNPYEDLLKLLIGKQYNYAYRLSTLTIIEIDSKILLHIDDLVSRSKGQILRLILKIIENSKIKFDENQINLSLVNSLNPIIKRIALTTIGDEPISRELAIAICEKNIKIGNKSSIQFADDVINQFNLHNHFDSRDIIIQLLKTHKYQSIELAYHFIKRYSLYNVFSFRFLLEILIGNVGNTSSESLAFARFLVLQEFPLNERNKMLQHICAIAFKNDHFSKLRKQILLYDFNETDKDFIINKEYHGLIINSTRNYQQIYISNKLPVITIPNGQLPLRKNDFFRFTFSLISKEFSKSQIIYIGKSKVYKEINDIWFRQFYIGQFVDIKIISIEPRLARGFLLNTPDITFLIPIYEVANSFVKDINKFLLVNSLYKVKIKDFKRGKKEIICSLKDLDFEIFAEIDKKIQLLKDKYKLNHNLKS